MRLTLVFLMGAAGLVWASMQLGGPREAMPVAEATRYTAQVAPAASAPQIRANAPALQAAATSVEPDPPPLFRRAQSSSAQGSALGMGQTYELVGIAGGAGAPIVFLRDRVDRHAFTLRPGQAAGAWTLASVSGRCATLRQGRQTQQLCLDGG